MNNCLKKKANSLQTGPRSILFTEERINAKLLKKLNKSTKKLQIYLMKILKKFFKKKLLFR